MCKKEKNKKNEISDEKVHMVCIVSKSTLIVPIPSLNSSA